MGTASSPIIFTSNDPNPAPGKWSGITFYSGTVSANSALDYVTVEFGGGNGVGNLYLSSASPTITNSTIRKSSNAGIYASYSSSVITRNTVADNGAYGIYSYGSPNPKVNSNDIVNNAQYGAYNATSSQRLDAKNNWWGDPSGPYHSSNTSGLGNKVSDYVDFSPWLNASYKSDTTPPTVSIDPVISPTYANSQTITGTMESNAAIMVTVDTSTVAGPVSYPTPTSWSCTITGLAPGNNTIVVTAKDAVGNTASVSATIWLDAITISAVSASRNIINTTLSEFTTISFTVNRSAMATIKIIPEKQGTTGTPVYQISQYCTAAGPYLFTWDGRDGSGNVVPDEAYLYIIEASEGVMSACYSPEAPPLPGNTTLSCTQDAYNPLRNDPMTVSYSITEPARINITIAWGPYDKWFKVMDGVAKVPGTYSFDWDGHDPSGKILSDGAKAKCAFAALLSENIIVVTRDGEKISSLTADPNIVYLSYGQFTKLQYTLSYDANVTVKLISPAGRTITLIDNQYQLAGPHAVFDDNTPIDLFDGSDSSGKKFLVSEEGDYTIWVQASPVNGANTAIMRGNVRIRY